MADVQGKFVAAEPLFDDLPKGWARVPLGTVVEVNPSGKTVSPIDETQVTFLPMAAVEELSGRIDTSTTRPFGDVKKGFTRFRDGDLLFAKITPSMENGKIAVARNLRNGMGCGTTEFHVLRPSKCIEADYLRYFVVRDCFRGEAQRQMSGAVGQQRVPAQFLSQYSLPLPPLAEQRRIVSRIDELFSRIKAGERAIAAARAGLKRYRKSILKAAVTGALTADWREERGEPQETGKQLLGRIAANADTIEPASPLPVEGIELPPSWAWTTVGQMAVETKYGSSAKCSSDASGIPVLRMGNLGWGTIDYRDLKFLPSAHEEFPDLLLKDGDLLFNRTNSAELVGKSAVFRSRHGLTSFASYLIRVRLSGVLSDFVAMYLNSGFGRRWISEVVSQQVGQANVNGTKLKACTIPLPPIDEQKEIVSRVEAALSRADHAEATLDAQSRNACALKQSILKSAFEGRLVPQDPNDEPADDVLARIAGEPLVPKTKTKARA